MFRSLAVAAGLLGASLLGAQQVRDQASDPLSRLDQQTRYAVELMLDSARMAGLPYGPLESKALEGISKRASGRDIVNAVRRVLRTLREARVALGPAATADELMAGAGAIRVGIASSELSRLAASRDGKASLTVPLIVMSDLVTRGVPHATASGTIFQLLRQGAADDDFEGLWRGVERDIVSGTDPGAALLNRARQIPSRSPSSPLPSNGVRPEDAQF